MTDEAVEPVTTLRGFITGNGRATDGRADRARAHAALDSLVQRLREAEGRAEKAERELVTTTEDRNAYLKAYGPLNERITQLETENERLRAVINRTPLRKSGRRWPKP